MTDDGAPRYRDPFHQVAELEAERDALAERADALVRALREYSIGYSYAGDDAFARDNPCRGYCSMCSGSWRMPGGELHAEGCLAAPSEPSTQTKRIDHGNHRHPR